MARKCHESPDQCNKRSGVHRVLASTLRPEFTFYETWARPWSAWISTSSIKSMPAFALFNNRLPLTAGSLTRLMLSKISLVLFRDLLRFEYAVHCQALLFGES